MLLEYAVEVDQIVIFKFYTDVLIIFINEVENIWIQILTLDEEWWHTSVIPALGG